MTTQQQDYVDVRAFTCKRGSPPENEKTITATIQRVFWTNGTAMIAGVSAQGYRRLSAKGRMPDPAIGQAYEFTGPVTWNERFGSHTITFTSYRTIVPTSDHGITRYLANVAKHIGPATARAIVKTFGDAAIATIKTNPQRIADQVPGLTIHRARQAQAALLDNEGNENAMVEMATLLGDAVPPSVIGKAIDRWGSSAASRIRRDPFKLIALRGIGFAIADAVWHKLHREHPPATEHEKRRFARRRDVNAIIHAMTSITTKYGDTVISQQFLKATAAKLVGHSALDNAHNITRRLGWIISDCDDISDAQTIKNERAIATALSILHAPRRGRGQGVQAGEPAYLPSKQTTDDLSPEQLRAFVESSYHRLFILTGAPGTGKTYTLARILRAIAQTELTVALCAPTGKAARQMSKALEGVFPHPTSTIHSLLEPQFDADSGTFTFTRNATNQLDEDVIVVDETSMVDVNLGASLLRAVRPDARMIFVGDHNQLPSVGPGAILRDMLAAGLPRFELTEIQRNAGDIVRACHLIKEGRSPILLASGKLAIDTGTNWRHISTDSDNSTLQVIGQLLSGKLAKIDIDPATDCQILSPTNKATILSCESINRLARDILNPNNPMVSSLPYGKNDKVVRLKNAMVDLNDDSTDKQCFIANGDIGYVTEITTKHVIVTFQSPTRRVALSRSSPHLKLAYCLTCHKMQGSEAPVIILPLNLEFARMMMVNREWLYTAISRAKRFLITVGELRALEPIIRKVGNTKRKTTLTRLLKGLA